MSSKAVSRNAKAKPDGRDVKRLTVTTHGDQLAHALERDTEIASEDLAALTTDAVSGEVFAQELPQKLVAWANESINEPAGLRAGALVRAMRESARLSQTELGAHARIKQADISAIETSSGDRGPTFDVLARVADACGYLVTFAPKTALGVTADVELGNVLVDYLMKSISARQKTTIRTYLRDTLRVGQDVIDDPLVWSAVARRLLMKLGDTDFNHLISTATLEEITPRLQSDLSFMRYIGHYGSSKAVRSTVHAKPARRRALVTATAHAGKVR
jgi:transcriptional regulator with XRE-family HTH domain